MKIPKEIFSEEDWRLGEVETSFCGTLTLCRIHSEPYRTMVLNAITDYGLEVPYENNGYQMRPVETGDKVNFEVFAKSALEENLWVKIGEVNWQDGLEEKAIFTLSRIRIKYTKKK